MSESGREQVVVFERVSVRGFRNLGRVDFEPALRLNVVVGDNGQGKTSLLEALYFAATSRSFRTERSLEMIQQGAAAAAVTVGVREGGSRREQAAGVSLERRSLRIDGKAPETTAAYATRTPVVVFHPGDLGLAVGGAAGRRRLLDRLALFAQPETVSLRTRYARAMRARQEVLVRRSGTGSDVEAYEVVAAECGSRLTQARREAAGRLSEACRQTFGGVGAAGLVLGLRYRAGGCGLQEEFAAELARRRAGDARSGAAGYGPQRDELELSLNGRSVRRHASQGQQRAVVLGLKLAELECVRAVRGVNPVLLLDDMSSELDAKRVRAVYGYLRESAGQVFVSTARSEGVDVGDLGPGERAEWLMTEGHLSGGR